MLNKKNAKLLSVPKFTANLYCICFKVFRKSILKQMQYRFAVNVGTLSSAIQGGEAEKRALPS